jgi:hypothetical protein
MNPILFYVFWASLTLGMMKVMTDEILVPTRARR